MTERLSSRGDRPAVPAPSRAPILRRACECGAASAGGECEACSRKRRQPLQRDAAGTGPVGVAPPAVSRALSSPGRPLEAMTRAIMEPRFGHDFSRVRVHTDTTAAVSAKAVGAKAYAVGEDIVFAAGRYRPADAAGLHLIAHELVHVTQTRRGGNPAVPQAKDDATAPEAGGIAVAPPGSATERQADRMAGSILAGTPITEAPLAADGLHLQPEQSPEQTAPTGSPTPQPARLSGMAQRLAEWREAGLLDPPYRPADVAAIPEIPRRRTESGTDGAVPALAGGVGAAVRAGSAGEAAPAVGRAAQPALRLVLGSGGAAAPEVAGGLSLGALAAGIGAGLVVLLWPSTTGPAWLDTINPLTGEPYSSPEEYEWERRLSERQRDYLRWLERARRLAPDSALEDEADPLTTPSPVPRAAPRTRRDEREEPCFSLAVPRRGGHARHDAYATKVSRSPDDYFVRTPSRAGGLSITYDGLSAPALVWEVKVGFGWFFNPAYRSLRDRKLAEFDVQKSRGLSVASACNYTHLWSIPDRWVAGLLIARWGGIPPVLSLPE